MPVVSSHALRAFALLAPPPTKLVWVCRTILETAGNCLIWHRTGGATHWGVLMPSAAVSLGAGARGRRGCWRLPVHSLVFMIQLEMLSNWRSSPSTSVFCFLTQMSRLLPSYPPPPFSNPMSSVFYPSSPLTLSDYPVSREPLTKSLLLFGFYLTCSSLASPLFHRLKSKDTTLFYILHGVVFSRSRSCFAYELNPFCCGFFRHSDSQFVSANYRHLQRRQADFFFFFGLGSESLHWDSIMTPKGANTLISLYICFKFEFVLLTSGLLYFFFNPEVTFKCLFQHFIWSF